MLKRQIAAALLTMVAAVCFMQTAQAQDTPHVTLGAGVYGFGVDSDPNQAEFRASFRLGKGLFGTDGSFRGFKPVVGIAAQTSGSSFFYAGLAAPFLFGPGDRWEFVFEGGPGYYRQGSSNLDLGGKFEFHLGASLSYAVTDNGRLGVGIYHISNANLHNKNPGVNSILANWVFSFDGP
jgi:lipid A 3-O-deacylase